MKNLGLNLVLCVYASLHKHRSVVFVSYIDKHNRYKHRSSDAQATMPWQYNVGAATVLSLHCIRFIDSWWACSVTVCRGHHTCDAVCRQEPPQYRAICPLSALPSTDALTWRRLAITNAHLWMCVGLNAVKIWKSRPASPSWYWKNLFEPLVPWLVFHKLWNIWSSASCRIIFVDILREVRSLWQAMYAGAHSTSAQFYIPSVYEYPTNPQDRSANIYQLWSSKYFGALSRLSCKGP